MTIHKALHPRDVIGSLYLSRKSGRGITSILNRVEALIQRLKEYIKKSKESLISVTRNNTNMTIINTITIKK